MYVKNLPGTFIFIIDTCRQFNQCFMWAFFVLNFGAKNYKAETLQEKASRFSLVQKSASKMLIKLTPWLYHFSEWRIRIKVNEKHLIWRWSEEANKNMLTSVIQIKYRISDCYFWLLFLRTWKLNRWIYATNL
jgi:hypothetical protein